MNPLARGGYEIRRRLHREIKTTSTCARFDAPRLARLSALGVMPDELGVMLMHTWRPDLPTTLSGAPVSEAENLAWSVFSQELTTAAPRITIACTARTAFAIAVSAGKSVAYADVPATGTAALTAANIDTVVIYARQPTSLSVCTRQSADPTADRAAWDDATVIASGLTLPLHETDPTLATTSQELAKARARLVGAETLTDQDAAHLAAALRLGAATQLGRPCDRVLLDRIDTDVAVPGDGLSSRIAFDTLDPRLRRVCGFGFADTTAVVGQPTTTGCLVSFDPADLVDAIYDVHQIASGTALPSTFRIRDVTLRFGAPTTVALDPAAPSALTRLSRRGLTIGPGRPIDGFVSWWSPDLSCVIDLPYAVKRVVFDVAPAHDLSCFGTSSSHPTGTPSTIPAGSAAMTFPAPVDQLRLFGTGTLYALRLPQPATTAGELNCACGPVQLAALPLPAPPLSVLAVNLQSEPTILHGDIDEQTTLAERPQPGFRVEWVPATLGGGATWPNNLAADPPTDALAYLVEHRRVYPNATTDPWEPIQAGDNLTFGSWPSSAGAPTPGYGVDLDVAFPLHRQRLAGAPVMMSVTDVAPTDEPPRAPAPLGSTHQYRIAAMDVVGRLSGTWTESPIARLEKHIPPPPPVGPAPEPTLVGIPPRLSGPAGVQARTLLAGDPALSPADTQLLAGHQSAVVLTWGWRAAERELDPTTTEFRVYTQHRVPTTVTGTITAVTAAPGQWVLSLTADRELLADECAGQWITSGANAFCILSNTAGTSPQVTVAASLVHPTTAPSTGPTGFGRPLSAAHQRPATWRSRVAVEPLTTADTYTHTVFDLLSVSVDAPTDQAWVGVSAADGETYVDDELPAAQPNGGRPGNESSIAAVTATARYHGRPNFSIPPPLGDVPELVTDEPTGRSLAVALDAAALLGGAVANNASLALDRCPLDAVLAVTSLSGTDVTLRRADGSHLVVAFANPADENAVRDALASANPERIASRYILYLLGHFDRPGELFTRTDAALAPAAALTDQLPPKPGRYFYRVRLADASGAVSVGGAILPTVVRVPSTMPMPTPSRRGAAVTGSALSIDIAIEPDPELAWALMFCWVGDPYTVPPDPSGVQLLRMPNRRDLYPGAGIRLRLADGIVLAPATTTGVAGAVTDADGFLRLPMTAALPAATPGQLRQVQYWCYALSRDGIPSRALGPHSLPAVGP